MARVDPRGKRPNHFEQSIEAHYMRSQTRMLALMETQMMARGQDARGNSEDPINEEAEFDESNVSVAKLHGFALPLKCVGPDAMYLMKVLKDNCAKHNQMGRPELIAATRQAEITLSRMSQQWASLAADLATKRKALLKDLGL